MNIIYQFHVTGFYMLSDNYKSWAETVVEEILCTTLSLENPDKYRFDDLKKPFRDYCMFNKA